MLGVLAAFAVVLAWFPRGEAVWNYPLHQIDAPAHYYFIRKILDEGGGAATHLWPNDAYYPPLFHLLAAGLVKAGELLGLNVSVYAAFNVVWLVGAGLIWPAGMQMFIGYWTRRVDGRTPWRPFSSAMAVAGTAAGGGLSLPSVSDAAIRAVARLRVGDLAAAVLDGRNAAAVRCDCRAAGYRAMDGRRGADRRVVPVRASAHRVHLVAVHGAVRAAASAVEADPGHGRRGGGCARWRSCCT